MPTQHLPSLLFFNDTATSEIYTLSLHDALPISPPVAPKMITRVPMRTTSAAMSWSRARPNLLMRHRHGGGWRDRKSTRLNSSHRCISYAVFCLKKKKKRKRCVREIERQNKTRAS